MPCPDSSAVENVLRLIDGARRARPSHPLVIAIDGPSGAGKSWLAGHVSAILAGPARADSARMTTVPVGTVHMDDLYPDWHGLEAGSRRLATEVLAPWRRGASARFIATNWESSAPGAMRTIPSCDVLLVEGCGSGALWGARYVDLIVWCLGDTLDRRRAVARRDGIDVGWWWPLWAGQEWVHFRRHRTAERAQAQCANWRASPSPRA